jgi:lysozyme family protein
MTPEEIITRLIEREGDFSNHPADRGGATRWGITRSTLSAWRGKECSVEDVRTLPREEAIAIYRALYFERTGIIQLPAALQEQLFDFAVNSGPLIAIRALQECLRVKADGKIGPITLAAALASDPAVVNTLVAKWRAMMLARIVRRDPSQVVFIGGWLKRVLDFIR